MLKLRSSLFVLLFVTHSLQLVAAPATAADIAQMREATTELTPKQPTSAAQPATKPSWWDQGPKRKAVRNWFANKTAPLYAPRTAQELIKAVVAHNGSLSCNQRWAIRTALPHVGPDTATQLIPHARKQFETYMRSRSYCGGVDSLLCTELIKKNPAVAQELTKALLETNQQETLRIRCFVFNGVLRTIVENNKAAAPALVKVAQQNNWCSLYIATIKAQLTPEQIKAAGI